MEDRWGSIHLSKVEMLQHAVTAGGDVFVHCFAFGYDHKLVVSSVKFERKPTFIPDQSNQNVIRTTAMQDAR